MRRFAFVVHPLRFDDFARKYGVTRYLPRKFVEQAFKWVPPMQVGHVTGVRSQATGETLEGWLIGLPLTPHVLLSAPYSWVLTRLEQAGHLAESLGAEILGLGAFTKIAGDRGVTLSERLRIPVTTGNSYTTASAVKVTFDAARRMGQDMTRAEVAIIGATGSIGRAACHVLARDASRMTLIARRVEPLERLRQELVARYPDLAVQVTTDIPGAVRRADVIIAVSSAPEAIIDPNDLKPGAVVTDVARPRNLSRLVSDTRQDVLVIDGGVIQVPGEAADMGFDFGFPPRMVEACMAETMALALEGRLEPFTLGPEVKVERVEEIDQIATRHGFQLSGLRRFERAISEAEVAAIRERVATSGAALPRRGIETRPSPAVD